MAVHEYLPALSAFLIVLGGVAAGPVLGIPGEPAPEGCTDDAFPGNGNASVTVEHLPDTAALEQARYGAAVWRLQVPDARIAVSDIDGRPTVAYKIIIHELTVTTGSSTILSRCHDTTNLSIHESTFEPGTVDRESYNATLVVTYRGRTAGEKVERELSRRNITVEVRE